MRCYKHLGKKLEWQIAVVNCLCLCSFFFQSATHAVEDNQTIFHKWSLRRKWSTQHPTNLEGLEILVVQLFVRSSAVVLPQRKSFWRYMYRWCGPNGHQTTVARRRVQVTVPILGLIWSAKANFPWIPRILWKGHPLKKECFRNPIVIVCLKWKAEVYLK